jgi:hypothetical protein
MARRYVPPTYDEDGAILEYGYYEDDGEPEESPSQLITPRELDSLPVPSYDYSSTPPSASPDFAGGESQDHDFTKEEADALWKAGVWDQVKGLGQKALDLFKTNGEYDLKKLMALGGGLLAANKPNNAAPTGYQGKIPKLTATSNMLTAPPVGRRPGSGGINYGGGTTYRDEKGNVVSSNEKTLEELRAAAASNPFNRPSTYENPSYGRPPVTPPPSGGGAPTPGPTTALGPTPNTGPTPTSGGGGLPDLARPPTPGGGSGGITTPGGSSVSVPGQYGAIARPSYQQTPYTGAREGTKLPDGRILTAQGIYDPTTGDVITPDGFRVTASSNGIISSKDTLSKEDAELMKGLTFSMDPNKEGTPEEVKNFIQWKMTQANPFGQGTMADVYAKQGITDPFSNELVQQQAQEQLKRQDRRDAMYSATQMGLDPSLEYSPQGYGQWEDPNWLAKQTADAAATAQRNQQQAASNAAAGVTVGGGGIATPAPAAPAAPPPDVNDWAGSQQGQAAGGINSVYNSINQFLATNPSQEALSSAMQQYGVDQATLEAAKAYGGQGFAAGGLAPKGFVVPADVVSHLGNGSSDAGLKLLVSKFGAKPIKGEGDGMSDSIPTTIGGKQEARVANDEAFISPEMVKKIGGGSAEKGAKKLYAMMDRVREERTGTTEQGKQIDPNKFMPGGSVKKYATGGTTMPTGATGSESSLSNWAGDYVTGMLGQGQALANKPYEAYTGPLTAGASGLQNQAFGMAAGLKTPGAIGQAATTAGGIASMAPGAGQYTAVGSDFGNQQAQQYMNPYLQSALNPAMDEARRQADISRMADAGRLTQAGAFGGSRQAIMESEGRRNLMDKQNQMLTSGYSTAFDKAQQQFNADQARKIQEQQFDTTSGLQGLQTGLQGAQTQGQLGNLQSQADLAGLSAMSGLGGVQRGIESEGIAADKAQFEEARLNPYKMVQFQQSLLSGLPLAAQSYNIPGASNLQQFAGGATTIDQLLKILTGQQQATAKN